jgi:hypothetical protein
MSLHVHLSAVRETEVYWANITHNLNSMAEAAGIYQHLWRPEELGITHARDLIEPLKKGLATLKADPKKYIKYNARNGWGSYSSFVPWVEQYLQACEENPDAIVTVSR